MATTTAATARSSSIDVSEAPSRARPTMSFSLPSNNIGNSAVEAKESKKNVVNDLPLFAKPSNLDGIMTGNTSAPAGRSPSLQKSSSVMIGINTNTKKAEETTGSSSFINNRSMLSHPAWDADSIKQKINNLYAIALSHGDALYYQSECNRIEALFKEGKRQEQREKMRERRKREIMALGRDKSKSANAVGPRLGGAPSKYVTDNTAQTSSSGGAMGDLHATAPASGGEKVSKKLPRKSTTNSLNGKKNKDGLESEERLSSSVKGDLERSNTDTLSTHGVQSGIATTYTCTIRDRLVRDEQNWDTIGDTPSDFKRVMPPEGPTLCEAKKIRRQLLTWKRYEAFVESCGFYEASGGKAAAAGVTSLFCRRAWIRQVMAGREEESEATSISLSKNVAGLHVRGSDEGSQHRREERRDCQAREPPVPSRVFLFDKTLSADGNEVQCQHVLMRGGGGREPGSGAWGPRDSVGAATAGGDEIIGKADGSRRDENILSPNNNSPRSPSRGAAAAARRQSVALPRSKQSRPSRTSLHSLALTEDDVEENRDIVLDYHKAEAGLRSTVCQSHVKPPSSKLEGKKEELLRLGGKGSEQKGKGPPQGIGQSLFLPSKGLVNTLAIADEEVEEARALMRVAPPIKSIAIQATPFFSGGSSAKTPSEVYLRATNNDEDDVATLASARGHAPAIDRLAIAYANVQSQRSRYAQGPYVGGASQPLLFLGAPLSPRSRIDAIGGASLTITGGGLSENKNTHVSGFGSMTPPHQPCLTNTYAGQTYNTYTHQPAHRLSTFWFGGGGNDSAEDWCGGGGGGGACVMMRGDQHDVAGYGYGYCASSSSGGGCYCGRGCGLNVGLAAGLTSLYKAMDDGTPNAAVADDNNNVDNVDDEEGFPFAAITRAQFIAIIVEMVERLMLPPSATANAKTSPSSSFIQPASVPTHLRIFNDEQEQEQGHHGIKQENNQRGLRTPPHAHHTHRLPHAPPHLGAAYGQKVLSFPTSPSRQQIANVDYEARFTAAWQFLYSNFFKPLESLTTSSSALGEVMAIANVDLAPRPLRSTQRVVYHLLAAHLEWLLIPLFDRYCELGCNYMTKDAFLCFASDLRLGDLDRDLAVEIFDKTNRYDTEGMLENTKLENLEFDEFVDAVLLIGCAQFGDVERFPTIVTVHAKVWETFRILRRRFGEVVVVPAEVPTEGGNKMDGNPMLAFEDASGTPARKKGPAFSSITAGLGGTEDGRMSIVGRGSASTWGSNSPPRQKNTPSPCFGVSGATPNTIDREELYRGGGALHSRRSTLGSSATPHAGPFGWIRGDATAPTTRERSKMRFIFRFSDRNISYIRQRRRPRVSIVAPSSSTAAVGSGGSATTKTTAASLASLSLDFYNLAHSNPPSAEREKHAGVGDGNEATTTRSYSKFSSASDVGVGGKNSNTKLSTPLSAFGNANTNNDSSSSAAFAATAGTHLDDGLIRNPRDILVFRAATHESPLAARDAWARPNARSSCYSNGSNNNPLSSSSSAHQPFREVAAFGSAPPRSDELLGVLMPPTTDVSELRRELLMDAFPSTVSEGFLEMSPDEVQLKWDLCGRVNPNKTVLSALAPTLHRHSTMKNATSSRHSVGGGLLTGVGQSPSHGQTAEEAGIKNKNGGLSSVSDVPRIPTQLTLVCPREICVDDLSSFLIGGIFLPNLSSLRDALSRTSRLSIVSTMNASSPFLTTKRARPTTVSTPRSPEGIGRGRTVLIDNDAFSGSKQIPAAPPSTPPHAARPTSSFFVTQNSPSCSSSRVTTGGGLFPTPPPQQGGLALQGTTAFSPRTPRLRQRSRSNSRRDAPDDQGGIVEASNILAKASRVTALLDALSPPIQVTDKAGEGMRPVSTGRGGSPLHEYPRGVAQNESVSTQSATDGGTTLSPLCPISVLLGPRGVEGKATQVARNRWKVTIPLGSINPRAYLPIVEVQLTSPLSSSPSWTSPQQQCLSLGSRVVKLVTKPSQRWRVRLSAKEGSEAYVSPPTIEHSIQFELKAVVDSLTPHQSEWLFTLFNTFADKESRLLTLSQFREHVLPQFVSSFPLVTSVANTLLRTEPLLYPTYSSSVSSFSSPSPQTQEQAGQSRCLHPDAPRSPLEDLFMCFCTSEQSTRVCLEATVNSQIAISHVPTNADGSSIAAISPTATPSNSKRRWRVATYPQSEGGVDGLASNSPPNVKGLLVTSSLVLRPSVGPSGSGGVGVGEGKEASVAAEAATEKVFPSFFDSAVRYEDREGLSITGFLVFIAYAILGKKATQGGYDQPATVAFADVVEQMMPTAIKERNLLLASHGINAALATPRSCRAPSQRRPEALTAFTSSNTDNTTGAAAEVARPSVSGSGLTPRRGGRRVVGSPKKVPPKNASPKKAIKQVSTGLIQGSEGTRRKVESEDSSSRSPANKMPHPPSSSLSPPEGVSGKPTPLSAGLLAYSEALLSSPSPRFSSSLSHVPQSSAVVATAILGGLSSTGRGGVERKPQSGKDMNKDDKTFRGEDNRTTALNTDSGSAVAMGGSYMPSTAEVNSFLATQARRAERRREVVSTLVPVGGTGGGANTRAIHEDKTKSKAAENVTGTDEQLSRNKVQLGSREAGAQLPYPTILKSVFLSSHTSPLDDEGDDEDKSNGIMISSSSPTKEDNREPSSAEIIMSDTKHDHGRYAVRVAPPTVHTLDLQHTIYSLSDVGGGNYISSARAPAAPPPPSPVRLATLHRHGARTAAANTQPNTIGKSPRIVVSTHSPSSSSHSPSPSASLALRGGLTSAERTLLSLEEEHFSRVMLSTSESHGRLMVGTAGGGRNVRGGGGRPGGKLLLGGFDLHQFAE